MRLPRCTKSKRASLLDRLPRLGFVTAAYDYLPQTLYDTGNCFDDGIVVYMITYVPGMIRYRGSDADRYAPSIAEYTLTTHAA